MYPAVSLPWIGVINLREAHRRMSGPRLELSYDAEDTIVRGTMDENEFNLTWVRPVLWLCITVAIIDLGGNFNRGR